MLAGVICLGWQKQLWRGVSGNVEAVSMDTLSKFGCGRPGCGGELLEDDGELKEYL